MARPSPISRVVFVIGCVSCNTFSHFRQNMCMCMSSPSLRLESSVLKHSSPPIFSSVLTPYSSKLALHRVARSRLRALLPMEPSIRTCQASTELPASPETEPSLPIEASSADGVDRPRCAVRTFHDEVLAYFLSQMWYDLIFVHVLRLRPRPFCEYWHLTQVLGQACALALAPALAAASASA